MCRDMKDSGVQWIGYIPKAWNITKIKMLSDIYTGTSISDDLKDRYTVKENAIPYISTKDLDISSKSIDYDNGLFIPNGEKGFRLAEKDSTLLCIEGGSAGKKVAFTDRDVNFVNKLCCIKSKDYNNKFIYYYINSSAFTEQFNLNLSGLIGGVSINLLKQIIIVVPTVYEQQKISNYLDKKVSQIDYIISKQKSLIEKYKAYKQSLITETVTKGLNKNVPMKDSGIEWIGEIPSHWKVERIKYLIDFNPSYSETLNDDVSVSFAPMECVGNGYMNFKEAKLKDVKGKYTYFADKDIIMAKVTPCFENGNIAIANDLINGVGFGSSELYVFRCKRIDNKFMFYYLRNNIFKEGCISTMTGTGGLKRVSSSFIENYYIGIPKIDEQKEIAEFLDKKCNAIDCAISKKEQLIEKLESYKKSLIYECVTGKREVN